MVLTRNRQDASSNCTGDLGCSLLPLPSGRRQSQAAPTRAQAPPIVGNIRDLPPSGTPEYQHWLKFKDIYGPISSIDILGQKIIILHDRQVTHNLLVKS
ncbi:cytochrome p450 oxidoreductase [Colletotrichum sojae]|uniref:Cytochrome p450 oxidoreductase n=1 Tax=Colletotrichum sojae TaxID=2175907 RepID=A0A8H6MW72_9PEZI|nr:cytochrome p450 oxidoreductase [Colletotrichum sojae]